MTAIILAGGFGTRLSSVISNVPKSMAPINDIPFLSYILNQLSNSGFKKVILAVGYLKESIISFFGHNFKHLELVYSIEEEPLGTGGAIIKALSQVKDEYFFVLNGDTFFDIRFLEMAQIPLTDIIIASKFVNDVSRYGKLIVNENNIVKEFKEKGSNSDGLINGGIYYVRKSFIQSFTFAKRFSWEKDFLERFVLNNFFRVLKFEGYFIDIGIPEDYLTAQKVLVYE
jgi:D-glycero-alpha-D-manno-heptose 1-phosphate guanylyltransferase